MMAWYWFIGASIDGGGGANAVRAIFFMDTHRWPGGVIG